MGSIDHGTHGPASGPHAAERDSTDADHASPGSGGVVPGSARRAVAPAASSTHADRLDLSGLRGEVDRDGEPVLLRSDGSVIDTSQGWTGTASSAA